MTTKKQNKTIPELVQHFMRSSSSLVQKGLDAIQNGDSAALRQVVDQAANTEVVKLVTSMVTSSREHTQALIAHADAIGNSSTMGKGIFLLAIGVGAAAEATALAGLFVVAVGTVKIVALLLILLGICYLAGPVINNGWERIVSDVSKEFSISR